MNSWGRSACYPRRTFYPLSDGPSIRNHQITKTCFRTCSRCLSRSQAPLCLCARRLVSPQPEDGCRLEAKNAKGGISRLAPPRLAPRFQRLPPILHMPPLAPLQSCSKGAQGLSVLPRVPGIFTESAVSLSPWPRQRGNRYAIRAGRNLPDKEFRYLRTVIVTAAVYRGFGSLLRLAANRSP